jgi:hypothetical protein
MNAANVGWQLHCKRVSVPGSYPGAVLSRPIELRIRKIQKNDNPSSKKVRWLDKYEL